jgi:hypothetical protein
MTSILIGFSVMRSWQDLSLDQLSDEYAMAPFATTGGDLCALGVVTESAYYTEFLQARGSSLVA